MVTRTTINEVPQLLFVYGTLRSGYSNEWAVKLREHSKFAGTATVTGTLAQVGPYGTWIPDPYLQVNGELYRLNIPDSTLAMLDDYEGSDWVRIEIETSGGTAWMYHFHGA